MPKQVLGAERDFDTRAGFTKQHDRLPRFFQTMLLGPTTWCSRSGMKTWIRSSIGKLSRIFPGPARPGKFRLAGEFNIPDNQGTTVSSPNTFRPGERVLQKPFGATAGKIAA